MGFEISETVSETLFVILLASLIDSHVLILLILEMKGKKVPSGIPVFGFIIYTAAMTAGIYNASTSDLILKVKILQFKSENMVVNLVVDSIVNYILFLSCCIVLVFLIPSFYLRVHQKRKSIDKSKT